MGIPIQRSSVGAKLQKLFGLTGRVRPSLEEYVYPVVLVEDLSQPSEADKIAGGAANVSAVAGQYGHCTLVNPADSRILVICDKIIITNPGATANFSLKIDHEAPARSAYAYYRDTRQGRAADGHIATGAAAAQTGLTTYTVRAQSGYSGETEITFILTPGTCIRIYCDVVNTSFRGGFLFRERALS